MIMSEVWIDKKFVNFLSGTLDKFSWKKENLANCRCPICGDSQKNKNKCRGFFYESKGSYYYKCHNCAVSMSLYRFLEVHSPNLKTEYQLERYRSKRDPKPRRPQIKSTGTEEMFRKKRKEVVKSKHLKPLLDLDSKHPARMFAKMRMIPKDKQSLLYFTEDFGRFSRELTQTKAECGAEPRIVIPFFDREGNMVAAQGRSLNINSVRGSAEGSKENNKKFLRYITIKSEGLQDKLWFGQWRANPNKKIYIVEGPLDSLFLDNCIAMVGASGIDNIPPHLRGTPGVYVLDNEPRNEQIVKLNEKLIDKGKNICIFPETMRYKDINDMILGGYTKKQIQKIIDENTFSGLEAKVRLNQWTKL